MRSMDLQGGGHEARHGSEKKVKKEITLGRRQAELQNHDEQGQKNF